MKADSVAVPASPKPPRVGSQANAAPRVIANRGSTPLVLSTPQAGVPSNGARNKPVSLSQQHQFNTTASARVGETALAVRAAAGTTPHSVSVSSIVPVSPEGELDDDARSPYATFVVEVSRDAARFQSPTLLCETILSRARTNAFANCGNSSNRDANGSTAMVPLNPIRVASACWALDILATHAPTNAVVLRAIRDDLWPALFIAFDPQRLRAAPIPIQLAVGGDEGTLMGNPFLSHEFFFRKYEAACAHVARLQKHQNGAVMRSSVGCRVVARGLANSGAVLMGRIFLAWRGYFRTRRVEKFRRRVHERHGFRSSRLMILGTHFFQWRVQTERARCTFLEERSGGLVYQLDNAKNQFQLQCYRSDKFLRSVEDLREELESAREQREALKFEVRELQRRLREYQEAARQELNRHVNELLQVLGTWRGFARSRVEERVSLSKVADLAVADTVPAAPAAPSATSSEKGGGKSGGKGGKGGGGGGLNATVSALPVRSAGGDGSGGDSGSDEDNDSAGATTSGASGADKSKKESTAAAAVALGGTAVASPDFNVEKFLLRWATKIIRSSVVLPRLTCVTNFTSDFQSGEVLLLLLHHVFPSKVPFSPLQESNPSKRLELIVAIGKTLDLAHLPRVVDLVEGTGDLMVTITAELFQRHLSLHRAGAKAAAVAAAVAATATTNAPPPTAAASGDALLAQEGNPLAPGPSPLPEPDQQPPALPPVTYDIDMMPHAISDAAAEMKSLMEMESVSAQQEQSVATLEDAVVRHAAYLTRQRLAGQPVIVLDAKEVARFCRLGAPRYKGVEFKYKNPPVDYPPERWLPFAAQLAEVKRLLRVYIQDVRRIFLFYSSGNPSMSDTDFWRFCGDIRAIDKHCPRTTVDRIFFIANSDAVPGADDAGAAIDGPEDADDEENSATELVPSEFVECLIRLADVKVTGAKMLHERFDIFMTQHVVAFACKNDMDKFKKEIYSLSTQAAIQRYSKDLTKIFMHFATTAGGAGKGAKKMLGLPAFCTFVKECNFIGLDDATLASIVQNMSADGAEQLALHEFNEAIVCLATFKLPTPFLSLDKKVDVFASQIISTLRVKLKGHLVLSDVKPVVLNPGKG